MFKVWTKFDTLACTEKCIYTCPARSRTGNQSRRSRSPSARTYPCRLSCRSSPGNGKEAPPARTSSCSGGFEIGKRPLIKRGRGNQEDKIHPNVRVVASRPPAIDKLLAQKVFVPNIQAAKDLNLWPFTAGPDRCSTRRISLRI